jgi:aminopeptidase N
MEWPQVSTHICFCPVNNQTVLRRCQVEPKTQYRNDYKPFAYSIETIELLFRLYDEKTLVTTTVQYLQNVPHAPLLLNGEDLELIEVAVNGRVLGSSEFICDEHSLSLRELPRQFELRITTAIFPDMNTALIGLYRSQAMYCTQCEAEGFRRITYYPDRPDVLARFTTRIEADKSTCPVLLANGNCIDSGQLDGNRHYAVWEDPFPKPCYLFALVAGKLVAKEDEFITRSGRIVSLRIYVEEYNLDKCDHAMRSLKKAMAWDEEEFGLEYDLDIYMIVAVDAFNMGAMENKGLNIFNAKFVLASPETATDQDYLGIEGVIAHEYFHNWTGNRVTCRDWFQLSLKEGLTVYRDQEFSADMNSRPVQRIDDVRLLKEFQFREDGGPMAHPVRPDSYVEVNNFYTATVYNKGAEVIRMMCTLLGKKGFRKGMDLYFQRHDGQAVTCDDFVAAMADASHVDLTQFKRWYSQSGTPRLDIKTEWLAREKEFRLLIRQSCPDTPGQSNKKEFHMPIAIGLLGSDGKDLLMEQDGTVVLPLTEKEQLFTFQNINEQPIVSFLRDFSAPVRVTPFQSETELVQLMRYDANLYNRWDASQRLAANLLLRWTRQYQLGEEVDLSGEFLAAIAYSLTGPIEDPALLALMLQLPLETTLAQEMDVIDPDALFWSRQKLIGTIASQNQSALLHLYHQYYEQKKQHDISSSAVAKRSLRNVVLSYLMAVQPLSPDVLEICLQQYKGAANMTETVGALKCLAQLDVDEKEQVFDDFYHRWRKDALVLDKWFMLQATSTLVDTLDRVKTLMHSESFSLANPNRVRALVGSFCSGNHVRFHQKNGDGYSFLADTVRDIDAKNSQLAARLVVPLIGWQRYDDNRQKLMRKQLRQLLEGSRVSRDLYEIVSKSLQCCVSPAGR